MNLRFCLRLPIPEIEEAALHLDAAVSAHLRGERDVARELFRLADNKAVWDWTDSIWGKASAYTQYRAIPNAPARLPEDQRTKPRQASPYTERLVHERDGDYCRILQDTRCSRGAQDRKREGVSRRGATGEQE
jgi:hypothetical protein